MRLRERLSDLGRQVVFFAETGGVLDTIIARNSFILEFVDHVLSRFETTGGWWRRRLGRGHLCKTPVRGH